MIGNKIGLKVKGYITIKTALNMKDFGKKTSNMEKVKRHGLMELHLKVNIKTD